MAVTGYKSPTANTVNPGTAFEWGSRDNLHTDNTSVTSPTSDSAGATPDGDRANDYWHDFGFVVGDIPAGATIDGIEGEIRGLDSYGDGNWHLGINVSLNAGSTFGTEERLPSSGDFAPSGTGTFTRTFGGSTSLFGLSPTDSQIKNNDFYISIKLIDSSGFATDADLEFMRVRIYFTAAGAAGSPPFLALLGVGT